MIRIGCSLGFWGDSNSGAFQLVKDGNIDYLVGDYLAEVTMGLLARMKSQGGARGGMGDGGFVAEFVYSVWKPLMKDILKKNIKVVVNAGGMNPNACKAAIEKVSSEAGLDVVVACVTGDDLMSKKDDLKSQGKLKSFSVEGSEEPLLPDDKLCLSFNAYLGAMPIVEALQGGAQVVVTGRCADSALILAPLIYEFGWRATDYDLLATGSLGGHILECGCQCSGGNFTDWELSAQSPNGGWENSGFPIVEFYKDGKMVVTKPENTGGLVSWGTVAEQIVYEIHNPGEYILPDVTLDFRNVELTENYGGPNRVLVTGAKGRPPTPYYKISSTYFDGYWIAAELVITGFDAKRKALAVGNAILGRSRRLLAAKKQDDFNSTNIEILGAEHTYGARADVQSREVVLRISVHHKSPVGIKIFGKEVAPSALAMAPGITGAGSGRPRPAPFVRHFGALIPKELVPVSVFVGPKEKTQLYYTPPRDSALIPFLPTPQIASVNPNVKTIKVPLIQICYGRSGDKGDVANIGIIAREDRFYPWLCHNLTSERVHDFFKHYVQGTTTRYEIPGIRALNFVLTQSLGGGGLSSLNIDRQGKSYAQNLLTMVIDVPDSWRLSPMFHSRI